MTPPPMMTTDARDRRSRSSTIPSLGWLGRRRGIKGAAEQRTAQPCGYRPPLVWAVDDRCVRALILNPGQAEQERGDTCSPLHPGGSGREEGGVLSVLDEPPADPRVTVDRAFEERLAHGLRAGKQ